MDTTTMKNVKIFNFLEINFYGILKHEVNDSDIQFSEKTFKNIEFVENYHLTVFFHINSLSVVPAFLFPKICTN